MNNYPLKRVWLALIYLVLIAYLYSFSEYGLNVWDEGGYANGTLRTFNGEKAMEDFNPSGYLSGRYIYGAIFFKLFGVSIQSLRVGVILITPIMIFLTYAISRRIMPQGFSFLTAVFVFSAPAMYYNRFFTFFCILNLYLLVRCVGKAQSQRYFFLAGAILLSGFFKFEVALFSFLCSVVVLTIQSFFKSKQQHSLVEEGQTSVTGQRKFWISIGLLILVLIPAVSFLFEKDFFNLAVNMVLGSYQVWGNPFPSLFPFFTLWSELGSHEMFQRLLFYIPVWIYSGVALFIIIKIIRQKGAESVDLCVLSILLIGVCAYGLVLWRAGFDNLLRTLPPAYILFCYILFLVRGRLLCLAKILKQEAAILVLIRKTTINVATVFLPFLFFYEMNINHGFYAGTIGAVKQETVLLDLPRLQVYTNPAEAEWVEKVVNRIENYSEVGDPILALPLNPIFYFLTDRKNPTPYDWILPGMLDVADEKKVIGQLQANPPKVIVYVDIPIDGKEDRRLANYTPLIYSYLAKNYEFKEMIGMFQILLPNSEGQ
ncbi:MAG: hypothetical protein HN474_01165 [Nitrospina sp.]|nr:hypothetical protein [Nitrospina sp.]